VNERDERKRSCSQEKKNESFLESERKRDRVSERERESAFLTFMREKRKREEDISK